MNSKLIKAMHKVDTLRKLDRAGWPIQPPKMTARTHAAVMAIVEEDERQDEENGECCPTFRYDDEEGTGAA